GLTIHRVPCPRWLGPRRPGFSAAKLVCDLFMFLLAWRLARRLEPDVVHAGEEAVFIAMFLRWTLGLEYVYDMDSSIAQQLVEQRSWLQPLAKLFNWCEARAICSSLAVAPVCHALADLAADRGAEHIVTLHDISQLEPEDFVAGSGLAERL